MTTGLIALYRGLECYDHRCGPYQEMFYQHIAIGLQLWHFNIRLLRLLIDRPQRENDFKVRILLEGLRLDGV